MNRGVQGEYTTRTIGAEPYEAFIPYPLPPKPAVELDEKLHERALLALGRLDAIMTLLPSPSLFLWAYIRKEALLSSQIEGTQSSFSDLLLYEAAEVPGVPLVDVQEVSTYVVALIRGLTRIRKDGLPLCNRLIREIHSVLLEKGRGSSRAPGEFRKTQNWVGGTRPSDAEFIPPPPEEVVSCMDALERFLNDEKSRLPVLVRAAMAHVQFETIHPFLDGNGRIGRLLIALMLCSEGALTDPLLYLSLYFKTHRRNYYDLLQQVRLTGEWEAWLTFFLNGVASTSEQAVGACHHIRQLFDKDRLLIEGLGRGAGNALRVHELLQRSPLTKVPSAAKVLGLSAPTVRAALSRLQELGIAKEATSKLRDKIFAYQEYLDILEEGTEPIPR